jgi:hypothetical protein
MKHTYYKYHQWQIPAMTNINNEKQAHMFYQCNNFGFFFNRMQYDMKFAFWNFGYLYTNNKNVTNIQNNRQQTFQNSWNIIWNFSFAFWNFGSLYTNNKNGTNFQNNKQLTFQNSLTPTEISVSMYETNHSKASNQTFKVSHQLKILILIT